MTAEKILAIARTNGVDVVLSAADDGLELLSASDPPPEVVALLKEAKPEIVSRLQMERRMVNHWVAAHLIDWPQEYCFGCRKRVLAGEDWIDVTNGTGRARFHRECQVKWRTEQEIVARRTIGLPRALNR